MAVVHAGIEATGETASDVRDELSERSDALYDALVEYGIDEDDITTGRFHIRETIDRRRMAEEGVEPRSEADVEEYRHYVGTHSFTVEVRDVEIVGEVVDTAVDAGADGVGRVEFTLSDEKRDELRDEALEAAIEDARAEAEFTAEAVGATIVEEEAIDTSGGDVRPVREEMAAVGYADDSGRSTEFRPDDVTVTATVSIRYEME